MVFSSNGQHAHMNVTSDRSMTINPKVMNLNQDTSEALNGGGTSIILNLLSKDVFDYFNFNRKSPTPSPIPSHVHSHIQP